MAMHPAMISCFEVGKDVTRFDRMKAKLPKKIDLITVDPANPFYYSEGNCLIDRRTKEICLGCAFSEIPTDGSVTAIGACAFADCAGLKRIDFPDSIRQIGAYAFSGCHGLTAIVLPDSIRKIELFSFANCRQLETVYLPRNLNAIEERAFSYNRNLKTVVFPGVVPRSIDDSAFKACPNIQFYCNTSIEGNVERMELYSCGLSFLNRMISEIEGTLNGQPPE